MSSPNRSVLEFLGKMLAAYGLWYLLYDLWLLPDGRLDAWISESVVQVGGVALQLFGVEATVTARQLTIGLFVGFVVAYPGRWTRRLAFIPLGMAAIYATNVARVAAMAVVQKHWPAAFDPLHGFGLTTIFYVVVFGLWVLWATYGGAEAPEASEPGADPGPKPAVA